MSMTGKIFKSIIAVATAVLIACFAIIFAVLYDYLTDRLTWELEQQTLFAAQGIESAGMSYFDGMQAQNRITWVGTDGQVLYDSAASEDSMENHADREEIRQAMENGTGSATRYSDTLGEKTVYFARLQPAAHGHAAGVGHAPAGVRRVFAHGAALGLFGFAGGKMDCQAHQ